MRSLREVKTQIYQTECGKYLKEGLQRCTKGT